MTKKSHSLKHLCLRLIKRPCKLPRSSIDEGTCNCVIAALRALADLLEREKAP